MRVKGRPVSKTASGEWCAPNAEYAGNVHNDVDIELSEYEAIATVANDLPPSDEKWPKGAVMKGVCKVGNQIMQKKS
ncbi:hypothetical protein ACFOLJ_05905 [Rugamonas sp. CCM 8940]|uniref:hypothetical protein n=1 Tax=Rugamonas sp. CCM 8940 TaxID=2765359 RepID=UPI0018F655C4|nr:hypothetical protein [Rugamonas sp. CCM 8940]MBJ7312744.1 hypothetical protein [Rugamonas sp. CCM 8940]